MATSGGNEYFEIDMDRVCEMFQMRVSKAEVEDMAGQDEGELMWAAVERLPSVRRRHFAIVRSDTVPIAPIPFELVDVRRLDHAAREQVLHKAFATTNQDNYNLLAGI